MQFLFKVQYGDNHIVPKICLVLQCRFYFITGVYHRDNSVIKRVMVSQKQYHKPRQKYDLYYSLSLSLSVLLLFCLFAPLQFLLFFFYHFIYLFIYFFVVVITFVFTYEFVEEFFWPFFR